MDTSTTRRSLLKAVSGAAAYGAGVTAVSAGAIAFTAANTAKAAPIAAAVPATHSVSPELTRLIAVANRADKVWADYCDGPWEEAAQRYRALVDGLPKIEYRTGIDSILGNEIVWREEVASITAARRMVEDPTYPAGELRAHAAPFLRLIDERAAVRERASVASGQRAAFDRENELSTQYCDTQDAVLAFPAASIADIAAKIDFAKHRLLTVNEPAETTLAQIMADALRLAGREG